MGWQTAGKARGNWRDLWRPRVIVLSTFASALRSYLRYLQVCQQPAKRECASSPRRPGRRRSNAPRFQLQPRRLAT